RSRIVMRVAAVLVYSHDWVVIGGCQLLAAKSLHYPLLNIELCCSTSPNSASNLLKSGRCDGVNLVARSKVRTDLFLCPGCFEVGDQITRTGDVMPEASH